jgi:hypothetical protein
MITIHNLDVRFDVEGGTDDAVFTRRFEEHIQAWQRRQKESERRARLDQEERELGDRDREEPE